MSPSKRPDPTEEEVAELALRALGRFVPTTEAEVERAEAEGVEDVDLPPSLSQYRDPADAASEPRSVRVASLEDARRAKTEREASAGRRERLGLRLGDDARGGQGDDERSGVGPWISHGVAIVIGAAAAAMLFASRRETTLPTSAATDTAPAMSETAKPAEPPPILLEDAGVCAADCCGGGECASAPFDMKQCPSGRTCISCSRDELVDSQYRFKVGGLAPSDRGKKALDAGSLEVCVRVASSELVCAPTHASDAAASRWIELPLVATSGDNLSGVTVQIRFKGAKQPLAEWSQIIPVNASVLCKGVMIEPKMKDGEPIGAMSMFLIDSHYVELGRASDVATLRELRRRFRTPLELSVFETKQPGERHFALVAGPFAKPRAERLRWAVLDAGAHAQSVVGTDYVGSPRPAGP